MDLEKSLVKKKSAILKKWLQLILDSYPDATSKFLKQEKDRFANPAGYTISEEIDAIYEELLQETNSEKLTACLDNIIRIRAVQDFPPSEATAFIFLLKKAIREELANDVTERQDFEELMNFESRIDSAAMLVLDIYVQCREKIHQIRVKEAINEKEMVLRLLEKMDSPE